jgi:hypothetical protein
VAVPETVVDTLSATVRRADEQQLAATDAIPNVPIVITSFVECR